MLKLKDLPVEIIQKKLKENSDSDLSIKYDESDLEINALRRSIDYLPLLPGKIEDKVEIPKTKNTLRTAARDITFNQAILELIDNSIDEWLKRGKKDKLNVKIILDQISATGIYSDNAGGMKPEDLRSLFIPGETTNTPAVNTIGSFGLGAKKALFSLSDGVTVISRLDKGETWAKTARVGFVADEEWIIPESRTEDLPPNTTQIFFQNIQTQIDSDRIARLISEFSEKYEIYLRSNELEIIVNELPPVEAAALPNWTGADGLIPRKYVFEFSIPRHQNVEGPFNAKCTFWCGILRGQEKGAGIDVFGNGRLITKDQKYQFGIGVKPGIAQTGAAGDLLKGRINIEGPSFIIPWDTHKRSIMGFEDHQLTSLITDAIYPIIRKFLTEIKRCTRSGRNGTMQIFRPKEFSGTIPKEYVFDNALEVVAGRIDEKDIPPLFYPFWPHPFKAPPTKDKEISFTVTDKEYDFLLEKYAVNNKNELVNSIKEDIFELQESLEGLIDADVYEALENKFSDDVLIPLMEGGFGSISDILGQDTSDIITETGLKEKVIEEVKLFLQDYIAQDD